MRYKNAICMAFGFSTLSVVAPVRAQNPAVQPEASQPQDGSKANIVEARSITLHSARIGGRTIAYKAVAGTLTIRDDEGKPSASMFYVAYIANRGDARRPLTFFYNGGPGSSSLWLHMGSFAPRRVLFNGTQASSNPPHRMVDNDYSLLPQSDLVFLDAINTGYSRPLGDKAPEAFLTADADIDAFSRGIERFLTVEDRWNSPKYLFGESYGTSRSAGVVSRLQKSGVQMNGLIQLGSILDISRPFGKGDRAFIADFPTYAVTAAYHGKAPRRDDQAAFLQELRDWVEGPYARALAKGNQLDSATRQDIARQMAGYTGISAAFFVEHDLRVTGDQFRKKLLRERLQVVGELDGRFLGDLSASGTAGDFDPSWSFVFRPMIAEWNEYVRNDLKFETALLYRRAFPGAFGKFDFRRKNTTAFGYYGEDLADAMTENRNLKVYALNGIYDFSTVFYGADFDYRHLRIPAAAVPNIRYFYYPAGHMAYVDEPTLRTMARDISEIYSDARPN